MHKRSRSKDGHEPIAKELFDGLANEEGFLTREAMQTVLSQMGGDDGADDALDSIMAILDPEGLGKITFDQFFNGFYEHMRAEKERILALAASEGLEADSDGEGPIAAVVDSDSDLSPGEEQRVQQDSLVQASNQALSELEDCISELVREAKEHSESGSANSFWSDEHAISELRTHIRKVVTSQKISMKRYKGLVHRIHATEQDNLKQASELSELRPAVENLTQELDSMTDKVNDLRRVIRAYEQKLPQLEEDLADSNQELENLQAVLDLERKNKQFTKVENESLKVKLESLKRVVESAGSDSKVEELQTVINEQEVKMLEADKEADELMANLEDMEKENEKQLEMIQTLNDTILALQTANQQLEHGAMSSRQDLDLSTADLEAKHLHVCDENTQLKREVQSLKSKLKKADSQVSKAKKQKESEVKKLSATIEKQRKALIKPTTRDIAVQAEFKIEPQVIVKEVVKEVIKEVEVVREVEVPAAHDAEPVAQPTPLKRKVKRLVVAPDLAEELYVFGCYLNTTLINDTELHSLHILPINTSSGSGEQMKNAAASDLLRKLTNGLIFAKLINYAVKGTIDERALNKSPHAAPLVSARIVENLNLVLGSASSIGLSVSKLGIGPVTLLEVDKDPHQRAIRDLLWAIIKMCLLANVNSAKHPSLANLGVVHDSAMIHTRTSEDMLLAWVNFHVQQYNMKLPSLRHVELLTDSSIYLALLDSVMTGASIESSAELSASKKSATFTAKAIEKGSRFLVSPKDRNTETFLRRAGEVLTRCEENEILLNDILKSIHIITPNKKYHIMLLSFIFNARPSLPVLSEEELKELHLSGMLERQTNDADDREARVYRNWVNSFGLDSSVHNLSTDCRDGLIFSQLLQAVEPGLVDWSRLKRKPTNKFQMSENNNYLLKLARNRLHFSLVGIAGSDLTDGVRKYLLSLLWQLMRHHIFKVFDTVSSDETVVNEEVVLSWANQKLERAGYPDRIDSFSDSAIASSHYLLNLVASIDQNVVDFSLVTKGKSRDEQMLNAAYAISAARKLGATVFLLPEDIVETNPRLVMTFVATLMATSTAEDLSTMA